MAEKAGKIGSVHACYGSGIDVANESVTLVAGVKSLAYANVLVSKVTSDAGGANPITKAYYCTVAGSLVVEGGGTDTVYVTYKYWNTLPFETVTGTDIAFVDGGGGSDTITSVADAFGAFAIGDVITISGSTSNNINATITALAVGTITVATGTLTAELAGAEVTIKTKLSGYEIVTGGDIAFVDNGLGVEDTITSVAEAFGVFAIGDIITITGSASNNITTTVVAVAIGTITVATALLTDEIAGETVTIEINLVGQVCGFFNWSANNICDILETTDYCDAGVRTYIAALKGWEGSAEKHFLTEENLDWIGDHLIIKFYIDVDNTMRYEGWVFVDGHSVTSAVDTLVDEALNFKGDGILSRETT